MPPELLSKTCTPCRGGVAPLTREAAADLLAAVPEWQLLEEPDRIARQWRFKTYKDAFALVSAVSELAEREGHHPDIAFGWGYANVSLHTHKISGLHENDFIMAAKIDALPAAKG